MDRVRKIIVGVDFSACSASALAQAMRIAQWNQASVLAVHVIEAVPQDLEPVFATLSNHAELVCSARRAWVDFAARVPGALDLDLQVEVGHSVASILRIVRNTQPDLLVLGTHGAAEYARGTGTVATACVRKAPTRVLLVREGQTGPFKSIVACIDFSEASRTALEQAARVAVQDGAQLHVLHVSYGPWSVPYRPMLEACVAPDHETPFRERLTRQLREFCEPLHTELKYVAADYVVVDHPRPACGIAEYASRVKADLIALGTRGRTNLRDLLWGSTAERVVRATQCSVLALKPEKARARTELAPVVREAVPIMS